MQFDFPVEKAEDAVVRLQRKEAVKKTFEKAWKAYKRFAWMHDEVSPISGGFKDGFGGWGGMSSILGEILFFNTDVVMDSKSGGLPRHPLDHGHEG